MKKSGGAIRYQSDARSTNRNADDGSSTCPAKAHASNRPSAANKHLQRAAPHFTKGLTYGEFTRWFWHMG